MTAMTDRDLAVAEKILRGRATIYNTPYGWSYSPRDPISGITNDVRLPIPRFCSNATWETEGMVLGFIQQTNDLPLRKQFFEKLDRDAVLEDLSNGPTCAVLDNYRMADWANALADVIMEVEDE